MLPQILQSGDFLHQNPRTAVSGPRTGTLNQVLGSSTLTCSPGENFACGSLDTTSLAFSAAFTATEAEGGWRRKGRTRRNDGHSLGKRKPIKQMSLQKLSGSSRASLLLPGTRIPGYPMIILYNQEV